MRPKPVEAIWFWAYTASPFKAVYGRHIKSTSYTKDFLQLSGEASAAMERFFNPGAPGVHVPVTLRWLGGESRGNVRRGADYDSGRRLNLAWAETGTAPDPWRVGTPAIGGVVISGDPSKTDEAGADAELKKIETGGTDPYLVAIKLVGEDDVLHVRAFLGNPPAGQEHDGLDTLPAELAATIRKLNGRSHGFRLTMPATGVSAVDEILVGLLRNKNVLLVGPPGTGKTVFMDAVRQEFERGGWLLFNSSAQTAAFSLSTGRALGVVFHPSYGYEDFVAGLQPESAQPAGGAPAGIQLVAQPGPLVSLGHWAADAGRLALLCLDEFNRGNAAAIFGDTMALLEPDKRHGSGQTAQKINRPFPRNVMDVAAHDANSAGTSVADPLTLPEDLYLLAAMNSSDRSVAPIDAALRRRFAIVRMRPDYEALANQYRIALPPSNAVGGIPSSVDDVLGLAIRVLRAINDRVEVVLGEDFLLGPALLWNLRGPDFASTVAALARAFDERVAATLRLTFVDQDEELAAVLNLPDDPNAVVATPTAGRWIVPAPNLAHVASPKVRLERLAGRPDAEVLDALSALCN